MALLPVKEGTVIDKSSLNDSYWLTRPDAIAIQTNLIKEWEPQREVWLLRYGNELIGIAGAVCGFMINSLFRHKLKLRQHGRLITYSTIMAAPGMLAYMLHNNYVTNDILIYHATCPVCYTIKSTVSLNTSAILYPLVMSPLINLPISSTTGLRIPALYKITEVTRFCWDVIKPAINRLSYMLLFNTILSSVVVYMQFLSMERIGSIMLEIERKTTNKMEQL